LAGLAEIKINGLEREFERRHEWPERQVRQDQASNIAKMMRALTTKAGSLSLAMPGQSSNCLEQVWLVAVVLC
jgi:hypothetical protein